MRNKRGWKNVKVLSNMIILSSVKFNYGFKYEMSCESLKSVLGGVRTVALSIGSHELAQ